MESGKKLFRLLACLNSREGEEDLFILAQSAEEAARLVGGELVDHREERGEDNQYCRDCNSDIHVRLPKNLFTNPLQAGERRYGKHSWYKIETNTGIATIYCIFRPQMEAMEICLEEISYISSK